MTGSLLCQSLRARFYPQRILARRDSAGVRLITGEVCMSDPARVQGLVPRPPAAAAAYEGLLHRLKLLIVLLLMKVLKLAAARITRQLAQ
jgi:hypothetical protein